jgi:hypothetical protein
MFEWLCKKAVVVFENNHFSVFINHTGNREKIPRQGQIIMT